jgi:ribose transport system substrate-binding protein
VSLPGTKATLARTAGALVAVVATSFAVAACGSTSATSSATSQPAAATASSAAASSDPHAAAVTAAESAVAQYSKSPSPIALPAITKAIPKNVSVDLVSVATPSIVPLNTGVVDASKALGWQLKVFTPKLTPQAYISQLQSIVQAKPRLLILFTPFPLTSFQSELTALKKEGVPIITAGAASYPVGGSSPVVADTSGANIFGPLATLMAKQMIATAHGAPDAAWVVDTGVPAWTTMTTQFKTAIQAAGGTFNLIAVPESDIGKNAPTVIVSYLQAHPNVKYVGLVVGAYDLGLQAALSSAGLAGKVQLSDTDAAPTDVAAIKNGQLSATIAIETETAGWRLVDLGARVLTNTPLPYAHVPSDFLVITKSNLPLANDIYGFPHDNAAFLKAWGINK